MTTSDTLLHELCHGPPDGRPLYAYRISDAAYGRLHEHLRDVLAHADPARLSAARAALFCLFVAEQSRRDPEQAGRRWGPAREALGIEDVAYDNIITWVVKGLRQLDRTVQSTEHQNLYRVTLGCEGGLALERLGQGDQATALQSFFRALLARLAEMGRSGTEGDEVLAADARKMQDRLPVTLRNEVVFTLAGQLAGAVWTFRRAVRGQDDPVAALEREHPAWKQALPVVLSGDTAEAFVRGLVRDVETLAEGAGFELEVVTSLVLGPRPRLERTLRAPRELTGSQVRTAFPDLPEASQRTRFVVRLRSASGDHARIGILRENGDDTWSFQPQRDQAPPADLAGALHVEVVSRRHDPVPAHGIGGCDELGPLPWVFQDAEQGRLLGTGSVRHGAETLIVALPEGAVLLGDDVEPLPGEVAGRRLVRVRGEARVEVDGDTVTLRTSTSEGTSGLYELSGRLLQGLRSTRPMWRGLPKLVRRSLLGSQDVEAEVRPVRGQLEPPAGDVEILLRDEHGGLLFKRRIRVVPADTRIAVTQVGHQLREGVLVVSARGLREVGAPVEPPLITRVERAPIGEHLVAYTASAPTPPTRAPLTLDFDQATVTGTVVLPLRTLRFEDLDGHPVGTGQAIHVRHLGRYRAVGVSPRHSPHIQVRVELVDPRHAARERVRRLRPTHRDGPHQLDLRELQQLVLDLLHQNPSLDAHVRLTLEEIGEARQRPVRLKVFRYDWNVDADLGAGDVCLTDDIDEATLERVAVEARPFADITRVLPLPRLRSPRLERPTWTFQPASQPPGAYLLLVSDDGGYRCRPTVLVGRGPGVAPSEGLAGDLQLPGTADRLDALRRRVPKLCADPRHSDWALVEAYLSLIGDIPPATFDLVRVLAEDRMAPACCAVRLATGKEADFLVAWDGLEALGVLWEAVPVDAWWDALDQLVDRAQELPAERRDGVVETALVRLRKELEPMRVIEEGWRNGRTLGFPPQIGLLQRDEVLREARQRLADADWPRAPDARFDIDPAWRSSQEAGHADMRIGLSATTALAQAAVFDRPLTHAQKLYLAELRALDEVFFRESTLFATGALLAARTQPH